MSRVVIDKERCKGCLLCLSVCPKKSLAVDKKLNAKGIRPVELKEDGDCSGCALCTIICPDCCIEVYK